MGCDNINKDLGELCTKFNNEIRVLKDRISRLEAGKATEPVKGEKYYFIASDGSWDKGAYTSHLSDIYRIRTGNYFRTKEEALVRQKCIEVEIKLRALIKRINAEAMAPKVFPDWSTGNNQEKYSIFLDTSCDAIEDAETLHWKTNGSWEYCYRDFLEDALKEIGKDELVMYYRGR